MNAVIQPTSPRHQRVIKLLATQETLTTTRVAMKIGIPKSVATTMLHYMEERGFVRRFQVGKAGKDCHDPLWEKAV